MNNIEPTLQDINTVFSNNPTAAQQLQIVALTRIVKELQDRLDSMYEEDIKDVTERSEPKESESK